MAGPGETLTAAARRWRAALLLLALVMLLGDLWALAYAPRALLPERAGSLLFEPGPSPQWNTVVIKSLDPASPLAAAGAKVGDLLRVDHRNDMPGQRALDTQESLGLTLLSAGSERRVLVRPARDPVFQPVRAWVAYITGWGSRLLLLAVGVLLVLRRPESRGLRFLVAWLVLRSLNGSYFLPGGEPSGFFYDHIRDFAYLLSDLALLGFVLSFPDERTLVKAPAWRRGGILVAVLLLAAYAVNRGVANAWLAPQGTLTSALLREGSWYGADNILHVFVFTALWVNWRRSHGELRRRLGWIGIAIGLTPFASVTLALAELSPLWPVLSSYREAIFDLASLLFALCLAWAVLRHRVFNFGLVVQRALALAVVSTMLLTLLGLGKWFAERLLHAVGRQSGLAVDLVIALVVVGLFALVQQPLIRGVNAIVFRRWHDAAEALRAFVDRAAQVTDQTLLQARFVAAVDAFAGGQGSAVYRSDAQRHLLRQAATLAGAPERIDVNDVLAIELRHGSRTVDLARMQTAAAGEWAFVMSVRGQVSGVLLLGARPDGVSYRPEELQQLGDSARRVGLDLESLRVLELERAHAALEQELAQAREQQALAARPSAP